MIINLNFKFFKKSEHIKDNTKLEDFYYIFNENNCVYRISFQCY